MTMDATPNTHTTVSNLDWLLQTKPVDIYDVLNTAGYPSSQEAAITSDKTERHCVVVPITCADGTTLSVQASRTHYCSPRECTTGYTAVEVGFPSAEAPEWADYKDGEAPDRDSMFGYVPVELVRSFIACHGGEA